MTVAEGSQPFHLEDHGIAGIFRRYRVRVPEHQRDYAWTKDEVTTLFKDFGGAINDDGPYFLGTVVTIPRGNDTLEVVDGQQRLATTAILIAAIRNYLAELGDDFAVETINADYLRTRDLAQRELQPKMTLNVDDNVLFGQIIENTALNPPTRQSHKLLVVARDEARKYVRKIVDPLATKAQADLLVEWLAFLEHRAKVVLLLAASDTDAYRMFETLNDRGLPTTQADLIKNFLFSRAGNNRLPDVKHSWAAMRATLESVTNDASITITFLRHALILQSGHIRDVDVYKTVQGIVKSSPSAGTFASTLEALAGVYVACLTADHEKWNGYGESARRSIKVLELFDIRPMRPLLMAIANGFEPRQAVEAFEFLVSLAVRILIASSTRTSSTELPLAAAAKAVYDGSIETAPQLRDFLSALTPTDAAFRTAFAVAHVSNVPHARYYLRSLEATARKEPDPWFIPQSDPAFINLEHILPKKPEGNWPQFDDDQADLLTTRIGNLALIKTTDNSDLKSMPFPEKVPVFRDSLYETTRQVSDFPDWTPETIARRQDYLADLAIRTWPIKRAGPNRPTDGEEEDVAEIAFRTMREATGT